MRPTASEIRSSDGGYSWTLYVHGWPAILDESFAVCERVQNALEGRSSSEHAEADEVAESIRREVRA